METAITLLRRDEEGFEQIVMGEVLVPDVPNVFGDVYTKPAIREFMVEFARQGYGIDIEHDQVDVQGTHAFVVESFIARAGDPDFIEGSWVVGMKIPDADTWQKVLDGEINGYSFEALCTMFPIVFQTLRNRQITGITEPDPHDGHTHPYLVLINHFNRPIAGGTGVTNGHSHKISDHSVTLDSKTLDARVHNHRFQVIVADTGEE